MKMSEKQPRLGNDNEESQIQKSSSTIDATEDDGSPVLDEVDLEENNLTPEEADNIEWDAPEDTVSNK